MSLFHGLPIRRKLTLSTIVAAGSALLLASSAFVAYELVTFRTEVVRSLSAQADIIARQSTSSLIFGDPESAKSILDALRAEPRVVSAAIYAKDGSLFASYVRDPGKDAASIPRPRPGLSQGETFGSVDVTLFRPIAFDDGVIGTVLIECDLSEIGHRLSRYLLIVFCVLCVSVVVAHWLASRLQRAITEPVQHLAAAAQAVSTKGDYSVRAVTSARDELGQLIKTFNDMLDQIQDRDAALLASETQYRLLFDGNPHPMWVFAPDTLAFLAINDAAMRLYGYSREEFLAMTIKDIRPPEEIPKLLDHFSRPPGTPNLSDGAWRHRKRDGSIIDVDISSSAISFLGRPARFVLATDVSERKKLEVQLLQSQKMEAVGRLAGGVAHDFNNLLGIISGYSELLSRNLQPEDPAKNRLEQIKKAAERAAGLTHQLLAFSRKEVVQPRVLDLNEVVADIEKMLQRLIGEDVRLGVRLTRDIGRVRADRGQIEQVILNLAVNARDAMPNGGDLMLETSNQTLDEAYARSHAEVLPGRYVMIAVSDTGVGMDAATLLHIFEPFFTTKEVGKGTGLGLATVFGIAKQSGGHVNVYSEPGKGATFKLYLPCVEAHAEADVAEANIPPPGGSETVLLVEDAEALATMITEILESAGFSVLTFSDPQEAVFRTEAHHGALDLILTDVVMPRMSGPDLVRSIKATRPHVKTLFMSGYTNDAIGRQGVLQAGTHFIQKPFSADALLRAVRAALSSVEPAAEAGDPLATLPAGSGREGDSPAASRPKMMEPDHRLWNGTRTPGAAQTVLVVDDDPKLRALLAAHVRELGLECIEAADGRVGLALARESPPSVVLLDMQMPFLNGRQMLATLKEDPALREIPVIVVSGGDERDQAAGFIEDGAEDYLTKPVNSILLRARLRSALDRSRRREQELSDRRRMSRYGVELEERVKEKTRSLAEAHQQLAILDEAKDGFLALMAHELRTPVTGALGASEALTRPELGDSARRQATELLCHSVERLGRMIEDALLLTKIKVSAEGLALSPNPLAPIWLAATERAASVAASRGVRIALLLTDPGSVLCDEGLLIHALASLLESAAQFAAPGETVQTSWTRVDRRLRLRIVARGDKIRPDVISRFAENFSPGAPITPGGDLGLGPAVAAQVLRLLEGTVEVRGTDDGVSFDVVLAGPSL